LHFDTTGGGIASLDEFMAMTIVGLVVRVNSEEFNVASILSSVDRQDNSGGGSLQLLRMTLFLATTATHLALMSILKGWTLGVGGSPH